MREFRILIAGVNGPITIKAEDFGTYSESQTAYYKFKSRNQVVASFPMQSVLAIVDTTAISQPS